MKQMQEEISWQSLLPKIPQGKGPVDVVGCNLSSTAYAINRIYREYRVPMLIVVASTKLAERFLDVFSVFVKDMASPLLYFPPYNISPFKFLSYHSETAAHRIETLYRIVDTTQPPVVVTTVDALMQRVVPKTELMNNADLVIAGEQNNRDDLVRGLVAGGYNRTALVEEFGDFSLRGGILDLFSPLYADPLRIEFFGDQVESIRLFSPQSQRTISNLDEAIILPAREAILSPTQLNAFLGRLRSRAAELGTPVTVLRQIVQRIKEEGLFPGIESLLPFMFPQLDSLFDYIPKASLAIMIQPGELAEAASKFDFQIQGSFNSAKEKGLLVADPAAALMQWPEAVQNLEQFQTIRFRSVITASCANQSDAVAVCRTHVQEIDDLRRCLQTAAPSQHPFQPLADWLMAQKKDRATVLIVCRRSTHIDRLTTILAHYEIRVTAVENLSDMLFGQGRIYLTTGTVPSGFSWPEESFALINDEQIFGTAYLHRKAPQRAAAAVELLNIEDLKLGEPVVHNEHGIGRYEGLVKLGVEKSYNDYLLIIYRDDDKLYLPVERMNQVQKYMGVEGVAPVLDKMGGATWDRVKMKVKRSTEKIAGELLKLYAARRVQKGHAFGSADTHFIDFEDGFPFEETVDQKKAIEDVLNDMRQTVPMDRLVCGDVGYGKTEVALRAAFLAVSEAKQVAVVVPTTVLAEQHYVTFTQRFKRYPVRIASMNRLRSMKEQQAIVTGIQDGTIDIVIGTHRLLQKDINFKELGLLILDEEQRFGVRHKEKIKTLRANVDVLTLTATPIPRTLHLSLLGIRDISLISTPPEQRRPIVTYITEFEDAIAADAIRKELSRNGQIFFVHNNINGLDRMAQRLRELVPEVRLAVAHGQMPSDKLEKVMLSFTQKRIDMLVCTTIIESGLDVTAANTILINRADHFGLAQIYQLRGRVGRGEEQAYAYLFIPNETLLTKDAQKRLKVLMEYSDLGSGFQIAMSDLKIRGGGTILGASQSGHIAAVGYDMFLRLMETSIAELKGEPIQEDLEPEINLPISAFLPEGYIHDIDQRLSIYRRLARMTDVKEISALKAEMEDRYGPLPDEAGNLLLKIMLKVLAIRAGCKRLDLLDHYLHLHFSQAHQMKPFAIVDMIAGGGDRFRYNQEHVLKATLTPGSPKALLGQAKNILIETAQHVNQ